MVMLTLQTKRKKEDLMRGLMPFFGMKAAIVLFGMGLTTSLFARPFVDNGDGTVTDSGTNLHWQKCSRGQNADATCSGTPTWTDWQTALSYCATLPLAGRSWHLPSMSELTSLFDRNAANAFPGNVQPYGYWTSTTLASTASNVWVVFFGMQFTGSDLKTQVHSARCVSSP